MSEHVTSRPPENAPTVSRGWKPLGSRHEWHPVSTVAATAGLSVVATSVVAAAGWNSPEKIDLTWHSTHTDRHTTASVATDIETITSIRREGGSNDPSTYSYLPSGAGLMPDVPSFNLGNTPEAQKIINPRKWNAFQDDVVDAINNGWQLARIDVNGSSSDETRLDTDAGIGTDDPQNVSLAKAYREFVSDSLVSGLKERGITVGEDTLHFSSEEYVLSDSQVQRFESLRLSEGAATNLELIERLKMSPESLNPETVIELAELLDNHRGGEVLVTLRSADGLEETKVFKTTTERCVQTLTIDEQAFQTENRHNIPITLLPFLIARRRRSAQPEQSVSEATESSEDSATATANDTDTPPTPDNPTPDNPGDDRPVETPKKRLTWSEQEAMRRAQDRKILRRAAIAVLTGLAMIKGDVGYCPNPDDFINQGFKLNDMPDTLALSLRVPFTDIETDKLVIPIDPTCMGSGQAEQRPKPSDPTCDTRRVVIVDGQETERSETNYPGATRITTERVTEPR